MITEIDNPREVRMSFAMKDGLGDHASAFVEVLLEKWHLPEMVVPVSFALRELVRWSSGHGASDTVQCTVARDQDLLVIELRDRGGLVPEPHVSRVDAEFAARL